MKSRYVKQTLARLLVLGVSVAAAVGLAAAAVHVLDWRVIGSGNVGGSCKTITPTTNGFIADCLLTSIGSSSEPPLVLGTHIGDGAYSLSVEAGLNPLTNTTAGTTPGFCFAASGTGTVTAANGDVINFNTVGLLCEEAARGSALQYNGTYRITTGTGRFADTVVGGGSLAATFERTTGGVAFIKIDGVLNF